MGRHIYEQLGSGYNCEVEAAAPGGWKCVPNQIGAGQYPNIAACIDSPNGCKKWECQAQAKKKKKVVLSFNYKSDGSTWSASRLGVRDPTLAAPQ